MVDHRGSRRPRADDDLLLDRKRPSVGRRDVVASSRFSLSSSAGLPLLAEVLVEESSPHHFLTST